MNHNLDALACPLPEDVRRVIDHGDLAEAERLIALRLADKKVPECLKKRLRHELTVVRRLPAIYPFSEEEALRIFQERIPGFTREELRALRDDGTCDWIYLNGKVFYHEDAIDTACQTRADLAPRLLDQTGPERTRLQRERLNEVIRTMKKEGHAHWRFRLRQTLTIRPEAERPGVRVRIHTPAPITDAQCRVIRVTAEPDGILADENEAQRTVCWDDVCTPGKTYTVDSEWEIDAPYVDPDPAKVSPVQPRFDTEEQLPQIRFTPFIRQLAEELAGDTDNPLVKARRFYDYVTTQCSYRYVPPYFDKTCIPEYFGAGQRGDCGMHALLFITLCRSVGIPAQWQAGLYTPPWKAGNHDWARFYIVPYGWLYADGSFGGSAYREGNLERWNFYFGNLEPWRLVCNRAMQQEFNPPKRFERYDPYDSQSGEVEYEDGGLDRSGYSVERELLVCEEI